MNKYDIKYIFKRVLIFFIIFIIMSFINSCDVHAETYNLVSNGVKYYTWTGSSEQITDGVSDDIRYLPNITNYYRFIQTTELKDNSQVLFPGQYLIEFYVYVKYESGMANINCSNLTSNFQNVNMTTGNWVSNEIKSQCVDLYKTTYNGLPAFRILYKFNYTGARTGADGITELRFDVNSSPTDFFYGFTYNDIGMSSSNIYDYDSSLVSQFNDYKQNQTIIAQNGQIISGLDTLNTTQNNNTNSIINNNNQNTSDIINNQDSNTQSVIDNQNQNKEDIINNQNANTDKEIESQQVCTEINYNKNNIPVLNQESFLINNGSIKNDVNWYISDYIKLSKDNSYNYNIFSTYNQPYFCLYNTDKELISCTRYQDYNNIYGTINNQDGYIRFSLSKENRFTLSFTGKFCQNGNQAMNDSINDLNDNINDDNVDGANNQVDDLLNNSAFNDNSGIQSIINAPLNFINGLTNSCSPINITIPYINSDLSIPCIKQELTNHVPTLVPILSTAINGFVIYRILIDIVYLVKSSRNPDDDRIEVLDL